MNIAHIRRYAGIPVIVQLRDAMALGHVSGPMQAAPVCNEKGEMLKKDGSVAPKDAKPEEVAFRPAWPIAVHRDEQQSPDFRFAIESAMVSVAEHRPSLRDGEFVAGPFATTPEPPTIFILIHYTAGQVLYELAVEPDAIVGITCVRQGPMAEEQESRLIVTGRN